MNKILRPRSLPLIVAVAGLLGLLLRIWTIGKGPDDGGLYAPQTLAWVLLWVLTAVTLALVLLIARGLKKNGTHSDNFPPSILSAVGCGLAALGLIFAALQMFSVKGDSLALVTVLLGIAAGFCMVVVAFARVQGVVPHFLCHGAVCLFMAIRIFCQCRIWSDEPQLGTFLFPFLAMICVMLAAYQLAAFDADMGKRRASVFWSLTSVYLCMLALPGSSDWLFYGCMALWLLLDLCSLRPLNKRKAPAEPAPQSAPLSEDADLDELKDWLDEH